MWLSKCRIISGINHTMKLSHFCSYMGNSVTMVITEESKTKKILLCEGWLDHLDTLWDWNIQIYLYHGKLFECEFYLWFWPLRVRVYCFFFLQFSISDLFTQHSSISIFHSVSLIQFIAFADGCSFGNLTSPLTIGLRHFAQGIDPIAAFWDFDLLDGHGGWWGEGCHIISSAGNITTIQSTHFSNFAVLMVSIWLSKYTYISLSVSLLPYIYVLLMCILTC